MRQQHNVNKTKIDNLKKELATWQQQLADIQNAKSEAANDNATSTDDYYRIPAIMQDVKSAYNLTWQGAGSWNGYTYVRTATMPNINGIITFKATLSIARKPKYFLGIKIHRAILQISWELTSEYTDTQVVDVLTLDPNASDEEKTRQVNSRISEIAQEFPSCSITTEYAKSEATQTADNDDVIHLLWSSDRLEIAREVDSRITKIYADLVSLEKMMHYKRSIIDVLKDILPSIDADQGRRRTLIEECYERWRENADPNRGNGEDNENEKLREERRMRHTIIIALLLITLFPNTALAQWGFDAVSVEAYINDHKKQRSLLLARSTLEYSNQLLHEYSSEEVGKYKELNVDLDKYTRAFDIIDVMYQSLRTVLNVKSTYQTVSDRISDYKNLLEDFNDKVIKRKHIELADTMLISINKKAIDNIYNEGSQLYHSVNDLVLYATGAAACSTSDLLMVLDNINNSLDLIEKHLNQAYFQTWRYVQLRMGYWKEKVYRTRTKEEILEDAFSRWKVAGKLDY